MSGTSAEGLDNYLYLYQVSESSHTPGYTMTVREVEDGVTSVNLVIARYSLTVSDGVTRVNIVIDRVATEDLGIHTVTVKSELGTQTYKVSNQIDDTEEENS